MALSPRRNMPDPADYGGSWAPAGTTVAPPYVLPDLSGRSRQQDEEAAPDKPSTFVESVKRGTGTILSTVGRTGRDVGLPTRSIEDYGNRLAAENPADVTSLEDIPRHPIQFAKETLGELTPQFGLSVAGALTGARTGGALGSLVGPEGTAIGALIGGGVGAFAPSWVQSYGGQRQGQDELGVDNRGRAALAATGSATLDLLGPETSVARKIGTGALEKVGGSVTRKIGLGVLKEAGTETGQEIIEDYGTSGGVFGPGATERYGMAAIKGGLGGAVAGGVEQTFGHEKGDKTQNLPEDNTTALPVETAVPSSGAPTNMLALPAPNRQLTGPDTVHGEAPVEPLRLTDQRQPAQPAAPQGQLTGRASQVYGPAIAAIESRGSGDYQAIGPTTSKGDRALGRYQMMGRNLPKWSKDAIGRVVSPKEFIASPEIQDRVFDHVFGGLVQKYGNAEDAASAWFTGRPQSEGGAARDVLGTTGHEYVAKFKAAMGGRGGMPTASGRTNVEIANAPDDVVTPADMTPTAILQRISDIAGEGDTDTAERLAPQIAKGGDRAAEAIGRERKRLDDAFESLTSRSDTMLADNVDAEHQRLQRRERTLQAAIDTAERLAKARGPTIVTEPEPLRSEALPAGPQPNPELAALGEDLAARGAQAHANDMSARSQMEQAQVDAARPAAEVAAETAERGKVLARAISDKVSPDPRADFLETLRDMGLPETLSPAEERTLRAEESFRRREQVRQAAAQQATLPEQDTSLGVPERAAPVAEMAQVEPTVAAKPETATEPTQTPAPAAAEPNAPVKAKAETYIGDHNLGPVKAHWFRQGMQQALGEAHEVPEPGNPTKVSNFQRGQQFIDREKGVSLPPDRPTREGGIAAGIKARGEARKARKAARRAAAEKAVLPPKKAKPTPETKPAEKPVPKTKPTPATKQAVEAKKPEPKPAPQKAEAAKTASKAKAAPKPAAPSAGGGAEPPRTAAQETVRRRFRSDVDEGVGKTISAFQAVNLNTLEAREELPVPLLRLAMLQAQQEYTASKTPAMAGKGQTSEEMLTKALQRVKELEKTVSPSEMAQTEYEDETPPAEMTSDQLQDHWARIDAAEANLRSQLDQLGLGEIAGSVITRVEMGLRLGTTAPPRGTYSPLHKLVTLALENDKIRQTGFHEAGHALRDLDLYTPQEWATMRDYAQRTGVMDATRKALPGKADGTIEEEAVVEAWARWAEGKEADPPNAVQALFQRFSDLLEAIRNAFKGQGFQSARDVFRRTRSGKVGARERGVTRQGERTYGGSVTRNTGDVFGQSEAMANAPPRMKTKQARERQGVVRDGAENIGMSAVELGKKGHLWLAGTEDIVRMAKKFLPSASRMLELHSRNHATGRQFQERLLNIRDTYRDIPSRLRGTGKGSLSEFLYDSTYNGKWGFKPDYAPKAVVDPDLAKRFDAIRAQSPKAAKIIEDVFRFNYNARNELYTATLGAINAEYDPIIEAATTPAQKAKMQEGKDRATAEFSRVFDTQEGLPYTPLKREGAWSVVGMSPEYRSAKAANDQAAMDKLRSNSDHYFVDFRDTLAGAEALRRNVETKFGAEGSYKFERGTADANSAIDNGEMYLAFKRMQEAIAADGSSSKAAREMHRLATDLYLHTLSEQSARKGELGRDYVSAKNPETGEVIDMMDAFLQRGEATTNYIASIANNADMQEALRDMHKELTGASAADRQTAQRFHNELMWRYTHNLSIQPNRTVDKIVRAVSVYTLLSSPFYYIQNATQAVLISQPLLAAQFGYGRATAEMGKAYKDFASMTKDIGVLDRVDWSKAPADVRDVLQRLADRGRLDAGLSAQDGAWFVNGDGLVPKVWNKLDQFLRMMPQRIEVMNRVVTGIAAYRAAKAKGMSEEAAFDVASRLIHDSHGDYSGFNSPRPFSMGGGFGKIAGQFRKFQLIMGALVAREFHRTFKGATKAERLVGLKGLTFLSAHMAAIGGVVAQPGAALLGPLIGALMNAIDPDDDKDWSNWQQSLREALGAGKEGEDRSWFSDLLYKGAPYALLNMDTSDRLGMGNMLSLAPYTGLDEAGTDPDKWYQVAGKVALGPSGGVLAKMVRGLDFGINQGDWTRMVEGITPGIIANSLKASRLKTEGLTDKSGATLIRPEDITGYEAALTVMGVNPTQLANQAEKRSEVFSSDAYYSAQTSKLKQAYTRAFKAKDASQLQDVRQEWMAIQAARKRDGYRPQPLSTLLQSPREQAKKERGVRGGVPTTKANRQYVMALMAAQDDEP